MGERGFNRSVTKIYEMHACMHARTNPKSFVTALLSAGLFSATRDNMFAHFAQTLLGCYFVPGCYQPLVAMPPDCTTCLQTLRKPSAQFLATVRVFWLLSTRRTRSRYAVFPKTGRLLNPLEGISITTPGWRPQIPLREFH